jgi:hypothetical protein
MQGEATLHLDPQVIAALLAFIGTVVAFFARKSLESRSINRAVLAEIKRLTEVGATHKKWWEERVHEKDTNYPLIPFSHAIYTKQAKNIGVLKGGVVVRAVQFYGYVDFLNALQASRPAHLAAGKSPEFDETYSKALANFVRRFGTAFDNELSGLK